MVRAFARDAMGRRIDPSWWTQERGSVARGAIGRRVDPSLWTQERGVAPW